MRIGTWEGPPDLACSYRSSHQSGYTEEGESFTAAHTFTAICLACIQLGISMFSASSLYGLLALCH